MKQGGSMHITRRIIAVAVGGVMFSGVLVGSVTPAQASGSIVVEQGQALRVANSIVCDQWVAEMDGANLQNFRAEPRIQYKEVQKQRRRWIPERWVRDNFPIWNSRRRIPAHWYYPPDKVTWHTLGALAKPNHPGKEVRNNGPISTWRGGASKPSNPWRFARPNPPGQQTVRCVLFFSGRATDAQGNRYNIATTKIGGERRF